MCHSNGEKFAEAYNNNADVNILLKALDSTIIKMSKKFHKKFSFYIDNEDTAQEVRLHVWKIISKTTYLKGMDGVEAYKYLVTAIRANVFRVVKRQAAKVKTQNKVSDDEYIDLISLSLFKIEYLDITSEIPSEVYLARLRSLCKDIENAELVLNFLTTSEPNASPYAGLKINAFYSVCALIKQKLKEISYE